MIKKLYPYRFEIFLFSQLAVLFGSLVVPAGLFESIFSPILFLINIMAGIILVFEKKRLMWFLVLVLAIASVILISNWWTHSNERLFNMIKLIGFFLFYVSVTYEIIRQVWEAKVVSRNVILGLISGYVSLGLIGFFICLCIELIHPGSFEGLKAIATHADAFTEQLMYFSYITLLTIGYGEIIPVSSLAQKATILIGLMGQIYLVVLTAIVVGKYINQLSQQKEK